MFDDNQPIEHIAPDKLTLHPVVFLFPELSAKEFEKLLNSIRAQGQIDAVWITSDNEIFDGRHRWMAQKKLNQKVLCRRLKHFKPELLSTIIDYIVAQNLQRRQLTKSQRAMIAATLIQKRSEAVSAQAMGYFSTSLFPEVSVDRRVLAQRFDVSSPLIAKAVRVRKYGSDEIIAGVQNGDLPVSTAAEVVGKQITVKELVRAKRIALYSPVYVPIHPIAAAIELLSKLDRESVKEFAAMNESNNEITNHCNRAIQSLQSLISILTIPPSLPV